MPQTVSALKSLSSSALDTHMICWGHGALSTSKHHLFCAVLCLISRLCLTLRKPVDCSPPGSSVRGDSPGKNTGVGCHALLQRIFPPQGSNPGPRQCRRLLYHPSHQGSLALVPSKVKSPSSNYLLLFRTFCSQDSCKMQISS